MHMLIKSHVFHYRTECDDTEYFDIFHSEGTLVQLVGGTGPRILNVQNSYHSKHFDVHVCNRAEFSSILMYTSAKVPLQKYLSIALSH